MISNSTTISANNNRVNDTNKNKQNVKPNFKGFGPALMNIPGQAMNSIENGGFVTSFLIQDTLGMTVPRTREGLYRDRSKNVKFKDMNFKEAGEVFIREFLSGPLMMFTPFAVFALTRKKMGKSTFTNTELLKKMSTAFTDVAKNKKAADTTKTIKETFYRNTIKQMVEHTNPKAAKNDANGLVNSIYEHVNKLDELEAQLAKAKGNSISTKFKNLFTKKENKVVSEKSKIKEQIKETKQNIVTQFNDFHASNSSELELANKVKIGNGTFDTEKSIAAMKDYAADAIKVKGNANSLDASHITEDTSKNLAKKSMVQRIFATVAASAATIGSTSIVPKIYSLLNPVPPGVLDNGCQNPEHNHPVEKQNKDSKNNSVQNNKKGNVQFKGNILKQLQFDGNQLTPLLMTTLATGGLIVPRVNTAVKRAPIDQDGKKNLIEVPEILTRDIISTTAVTYGVPILSKAMVKTYENKSGFVLTGKPKEQQSTIKKLLDVINPFSSHEPYSNKDLKEIYGNVNTKQKLANFAEFIDKNDGSLVKVFKTLKNGEETFKNTDADFNSISKLDRKTANSKIMQVISEKFDDSTVAKFIESNNKKAKKAGEPIANGMLQRARSLNSTPKLLNTLILVPVFLGMILPKIVYGITAKNRKKYEMAQMAKRQQASANNNTTNNTNNKPQQVAQKDMQTKNTFNQLKHNK